MIVLMDRQDSNIDNTGIVNAYHVCKRGVVKEKLNLRITYGSIA